MQGNLDFSLQEKKFTKELPEKDIKFISNLYHSWLGKKDADEYQNILGVCFSTTKEEIEQHNYAFVPGRYTGVEEIEDDDEEFYPKMGGLLEQLDEEFKKSTKLNGSILEEFKSILK